MTAINLLVESEASFLLNMPHWSAKLKKSTFQKQNSSFGANFVRDQEDLFGDTFPSSREKNGMEISEKNIIELLCFAHKRSLNIIH